MDVVVVGSCNIDLVRYVTLIDACHYAKRHGKCVVKRECGNIHGDKFILNLGEVKEPIGSHCTDCMDSADINYSHNTKISI